jgi:hypothetical protein
MCIMDILTKKGDICIQNNANAFADKLTWRVDFSQQVFEIYSHAIMKSL